MGPHRAATIGSPPSSDGSRPNIAAARRSGSANVTHAAAVDPGHDRRRIDTRRGRDLARASPADTDAQRAGSPRRPTLGTAECEEARVLAGAVVLDRRRARAALELAPPRRRHCEQSPHGGKLLGPARCDAHAIAISSSSRSGRARTTGSAWIGFADERRKVTSSGSPATRTIRPSRRRPRAPCRASTTSPRVTSTRIGSTVAEGTESPCPPKWHQGHYAGRMPELPEVEAWVRELDPLVARAPIERRGRAHRDAEDVRPAAERTRGADVRRARGGAARTCSSRPSTASSCSAST